MICLNYEPEALSIRVTDDGSGPLVVDGGPSGHGLTGMAERAAAVGGSFFASAGTDGGFEVMARLRIATPGQAPPDRAQKPVGGDVVDRTGGSPRPLARILPKTSPHEGEPRPTRGLWSQPRTSRRTAEAPRAENARRHRMPAAPGAALLWPILPYLPIS